MRKEPDNKISPSEESIISFKVQWGFSFSFISRKDFEDNFIKFL